MSCENEIAGLLPFYAAGTLDERERPAVEQHLSACEACRAELLFWEELGRAVEEEDAALPAPPAPVLTGVLRAVRDEQPGVFVRAWQLLLSQVPLVRREIWLASALVFALGLALAFLAPADEPAVRILEALAPLVAAAGVAMIYDRDNEPAMELSLATPTSPRRILLARLVLIFGYDLLLALAASAVLLAALPASLPEALILGWLGPMTFLSALALVLSLIIGTRGATTVVLALWFARWLMGGGTTMATGATYTWGIEQAARLYLSGWGNPGLLFALAGVLTLTAFWLAGRPGVLLPRSAQSA